MATWCHTKYATRLSLRCRVVTQINLKPGENTGPLSMRAQRNEDKKPMEVTKKELGIKSSPFIAKFYHQVSGKLNNL